MNSDEYEDIFEPFGELVEIEICGEKRKVPENNTLLRCFQYLSMETISAGDFCWNGDCANCRVWLEDAEHERRVISCRTQVRKAMRIVRLSGEIKLSEK